jgi:hypothetical protein
MQHLLLLVIGLLVAGLTFTVIKWPGGLHMTFSQYAATNRWSKLFYCLLFVVTMPLLLWFFVVWFAPHNNLSAVFSWCAGVAVLFQILCTLVPETGGVRTTVHGALVSVSVLAMMPLVVMIGLSSDISTTVRLAAWIGLAAMLALLCTALMYRQGFRWVLLLQAGYYVAFLGVLLTATYL